MSSLLNPLRRVLLIALIGLSFAPLSLPHAQAATFTVTNCNDSGQGSLRQAISDANTSPGSDTIEFNVTCSPITLVSSGFPTITDNLTILGPGAGNLAIDGAGQYGVFVIESGVSVTLSGLTIQNAGSTAQSAVRNIGGNLTVQACVFKDNVTASTGGAIRNQDNSTLTIADTTFSNNSARDGAAIYNSETLNISNSTFSNNTAGEYGGAINHQSGTATITNSTFTGNSTGCFGGAISTQGTLILIHSTLSTNTSDHRGGGIDQMGGTMTVRNSIVAGNTAATFPDMRVFNADASDNIIGTDPMLGPLADNGGPTQTMMPLPGSPAIDSAASADCQPADQRGVTRPLDGDMDGTPACDIGAVEAPGPLTPVQVQSITRADASPTNASDVRFTVTFDAPVTGVTASHFTLTTSGLTGALISGVSGLATTWTVTAATGTGDGTLRLDMIYAAGVSGPGGVPVVNVPFTTGETYTIDKSGPTVTLSSAAPDPTNTAPIPVAVTFSEAVTGFEAIDLVVSNGTVSNFTGSGTSFTFDLTPIADGLVTVSVPAGVAQDTAGNGNTAAATQLTRTYDSTAPTVALSSTAPDPTNTAPIQVTVTFSEAVTGFEASDLTISNGTVTNFTGSGASYGFDVTPIAGGLVTVSVPAGVAQDAAGNTNTAATQLTRTYDSTAPTVTVEQATTQADPTNAAPVAFTVTFSEDVTGFEASDVLLSGTAGATTATVSGGPAVYTVEVSGMAAFGTVIANVRARAGSDAAGNLSVASTSVDNSVTYADSSAPGVLVDPLVLDLLEGGPAQTYTVRLASHPLVGESVTVSVTPSDPGLNADPTALTFDNSTWDTPQTVTVRALDNALAEGTRTASIAHAVSSSNPATPYGDGSLTVPTVSVTIQDDDTPDIALAETDGGTTVTSGGPADTYTVALSLLPAAGETVTVALTFDAAQLSVIPATLTFDDATGTTPQTVTVEAAGSVSSAVTSPILHTAHSSTASPYEGVTATLVVHLAAGADPAPTTPAPTTPSPTTPAPSTPAPAAPTVAASTPIPLPLCADFDGSTNAAVRADVPPGTVGDGSVFCRVMVEHGAFREGGYAAAIGVPAALERGVLQAVDVFGLTHGAQPVTRFATPIRVCLQGSGALLYLNATTAPRQISEPPVTREGGYTCAILPNAGTLIMVAGEPVSVLSADTSQPARPLSGCMVHTERILNLRAAPDTGSDVRALVPYDVTLTATQREGAWYQVDYLGLSGWLSAAYLTPQGSCD